MGSVEQVWYCKDGHDPIATIGENGPVQCEECNKDMTIIGWMEEDAKGEQGEQAD